MQREAALAQTFVELADTLVAEFDVVELLTLLADRCVEVLGVDAAGIMLSGPDSQLRLLASSSEGMRVLELFQLQAKEGPCVDAFNTGKPIVSLNLADARGRWPRFAPQALEAGYNAAHSLPMRLRGRVIGALNLFHVGVGNMHAHDLAAAQAFADVATIGILQNEAALEAQVLNEQLNRALNSRIVIEQSKGMVAERENIAMEEAFGLLRTYARNNNRRLADVAHDIIDGKLGADAFPSPKR